MILRHGRYTFEVVQKRGDVDFTVCSLRVSHIEPIVQEMNVEYRTPIGCPTGLQYGFSVWFDIFYVRVNTITAI